MISIRCFGFGATAVFVLAALSGCAPYQVEAPPAEQSRTVINPPRSDRGNPPFYEVYGRA